MPVRVLVDLQVSCGAVVVISYLGLELVSLRFSDLCGGFWAVLVVPCLEMTMPDEPLNLLSSCSPCADAPSWLALWELDSRSPSVLSQQRWSEVH